MIHQMGGALSEDGWLITEDELDRGRMRFYESILTLGNGYLGSRSILEEGYDEAYAGTYLAGVYDKSGGQSFAIVNAPNPLGTEILVDGVKLSADDMEVVEHHRALDMKRALLYRSTMFAKGDQRYEYKSMRFFNLHNMHWGVVVFSLRSLDSDASVVVKHIIDGTTRNEMHAVGGPRKHYRVTQSKACGDVSYLEARTNDLGIVLGMASAVDFEDVEAADELETGFASGGEAGVLEQSFRARKGHTYHFRRHIAIHTSRETRGDIEAACFAGVTAARRRGVTALLADHQEAWEKRWHSADIEIGGDEGLQRALRFALYHLLIAAPPEDIDVSIAPKALSGEWYQGHVFWDTEIFMLPFFVHAQPQLARQLLLYRARRLEQARERAVAQGYRGALWPWESADSGMEETPDTWVNFDGTVLPVYNAKREHHIACDIVYGIHLYHVHTGDEEFMLDYGLPMVLETARFWASRVSHDEATDSYEIKQVIGPNEFQEGVDNNSYTNAMARWTLRYACGLCKDFSQKHSGEMQRIAGEIHLSEEEIRSWERIADRIVLLMGSDGLLEEFEGYFGRRDVTITEWDEHGMPVWPADVLLRDVKETQLIKQADVVLLLYLLSDQFPLDVERVNFEYYEPRTTHKSSLSIASYAILASELGDTGKAYRYLRRVANSDLENIRGNTELGVHAAELGGTWQIVVRGLAGVRVRGGVLSVDPRLPEHWQGMRFRTWFRRNLLAVTISGGEVVVSMEQGRDALEMDICGQRRILEPGGTMRVKR